MYRNEAPANQHSSAIAEKLQTNERLLDRLSSKYPATESPEFASLVRPSDRDEPGQRLFHYREGYTVELCRKLIVEDSGPILDPFCGFGSTLLAAKEKSIKAIGFDVNPLAICVSEAKTTNYSPREIDEFRRFRDLMEAVRPTDHRAASPDLRIIDKLFHTDILTALNVFKAQVQSIDNQKIRRLAFVCWLAILEDVSNVFREGNGVKYRNRVRRGNEYTTIPYDEWANQYFPDDKFSFVRNAYLKKLEVALSDIEIRPLGSEPRIIGEDSLSLGRFVAAGTIGHALFSPPYCNLFNYIKAYKLELWMGGFIQSYGDVRTLTGRGIRSRLEGLTASTDPVDQEVEQFAHLVEEADTWSDAIPAVVRGYFSDMQAVLGAVHGALRPGGRASVVVGNSALGGVLIPTDMLLASIAEKIGFSVAELKVARHLTTSSQQKKNLGQFKKYMRETIIELRK
ncbi:class I SAM-dependent methyltransferase [Rhizobium ruizarguesonis]|uniref:hypothetical protein n=1 Tax=Rhizobium ruizarguesonis TaxID=2081791 RepID=UPI001031C184|nr:hypothetical protein [Rhizobium ruizarguesonis]TAW11136.1 hypothetical protein ELI26_17070 [Rhizobium ruizarguesonis]